jgi:succinyl-CoA synthetase alpha subunit
MYKMSILIDENTMVVVQGLTGYQAQFDSRHCLEYGTKIVGGVVPGRAGETVMDLPLFNTMDDAVAATGANTSVIYVPARGAMDAILEAAYAGIKLVQIITEKIPYLDFSRAYHIARRLGTRIIGPNSNGIISPGKSKIGILGNDWRYFTPGPVGVISRSGGMNHELGNLLTRADIGQSTCVSIGGDPMVGSTIREVLELFEKDEETEVVVLYCEPGGRMEEDAAELIRTNDFSKPVVAYVAGLFMEEMPEGIPFGHAGAIIEGGVGRPTAKKEILADAGVHVAERVSDIPEKIKSLSILASTGASEVDFPVDPK